MPTVKVYNMAGQQTGEMELNAAVFGIEPNVPAMHAAVKNYLANCRQGTQSTLTRSEVRGGGIKPWRQKGTGRARQGSIRAPQWTHGGIALGPKPRAYGIDVNKKVKRLAMKSALSAKVAANEMIVLDGFGLDAIKTKDVAAVLEAVKADKKTLIVLPEKDDVVYKSARNLDKTNVTLVSTLNVYDILNCNTIVVLKDAVAKIEEVYA